MNLKEFVARGQAAQKAADQIINATSVHLERELARPPLVMPAAKVRPKKFIIHAPKGYGFVAGKGSMLVRDRADLEKIAMTLKVELRRCAWPTTKFKVRGFNEPGQKSTYFVNIGHLRGLDPNALYQTLRALPDKCGARRIMAAIERLPEQVERFIPAQPREAGA